MATKNVTGVAESSTTKLALVGESELQAWLDNPTNYNTVTIRDPKTKAVKKTVQVKRNLTLSANVPTTLYAAACNYAADEMAGGRTDNDVSPGFLTRANRRALFGFFMPEFDALTWEATEVERISAERSERMSAIASARGESVEQVRNKLSILEKLLANPAMRKVAQSDPELSELIELLGGDNEA